MSKTYVGDTGTALDLDCGTDITDATARSIEVRKPDGSVLSWEALASGTDAMRYVTEADTLDMPGAWRLQALVTTSDGQWRGETALLQVYSPYS